MVWSSCATACTTTIPGDAGCVVYNVVLFVCFLGGVAATESVISERCWVEDVCTPVDDVIIGAVSISWIALVVVTIALGWRGRLPGARKPAA
jgi:hypothetical protein